MKRVNKLLVGLLIVSLLLLVCGAKENRAPQQEVYYNQEQDGFYVRLKGTDKTGTKFAPYLGSPDNKQRIERLEAEYTQMVQEIQREQAQKARKKGKIVLLGLVLALLVVGGLGIRWGIKKVTG